MEGVGVGVLLTSISYNWPAGTLITQGEAFLRKEPHLIGFLLSSSLVQISLELYISKP